MGPRQICHFLGGVLAPQRLVSVRETAEPRNNFMILPRVLIVAMAPFDQEILISLCNSGM
jgi:hypothetical protein